MSRISNPDKVVAVGTSKHGKWTYYTIVIYEAELTKDGRAIYKKSRVIAEYSSRNKTIELAKQYADSHGIAFMPNVRHNDRVTNPKGKKNPTSRTRSIWVIIKNKHTGWWQIINRRSRSIVHQTFTKKQAQDWIKNTKTLSPSKNPSELLKSGQWTPAHAIRIRKGKLEILR
jgi:hypothetical protein